MLVNGFYISFITGSSINKHEINLVHFTKTFKKKLINLNKYFGLYLI